jgi:hypothetical protein
MDACVHVCLDAVRCLQDGVLNTHNRQPHTTHAHTRTRTLTSYSAWMRFWMWSIVSFLSTIMRWSSTRRSSQGVTRLGSYASTTARAQVSASGCE